MNTGKFIYTTEAFSKFETVICRKSQDGGLMYLRRVCKGEYFWTPNIQDAKKYRALGCKSLQKHLWELENS